MLLFIELDKDAQHVIPVMVLVIETFQYQRRFIVLPLVNIGVSQRLLVSGDHRFQSGSFLNTSNRLVFLFQSTIILAQIVIRLRFGGVNLQTMAQQVESRIVIPFGTLANSLQEESVIATTRADGLRKGYGK